MKDYTNLLTNVDTIRLLKCCDRAFCQQYFQSEDICLYVNWPVHLLSAKKNRSGFLPHLLILQKPLIFPQSKKKSGEKTALAVFEKPP